MVKWKAEVPTLSGSALYMYGCAKQSFFLNKFYLHPCAIFFPKEKKNRVSASSLEAFYIVWGRNVVNRK